MTRDGDYASRPLMLNNSVFLHGQEGWVDATDASILSRGAVLSKRWRQAVIPVILFSLRSAR